MKSSGYFYVLEEQAVDALFALAESEQDLLLSYFRLLASQPRAEGAAWCMDETGRKNFADTVGPFTVVHWVDHAVREVRIVEFKRS